MPDNPNRMRTGAPHARRLAAPLQHRARIGWLTHTAYTKHSGSRGQGAALTTGSAPWPLATDQTEVFNRLTLGSNWIKIGGNVRSYQRWRTLCDHTPIKNLEIIRKISAIKLKKVGILVKKMPVNNPGYDLLATPKNGRPLRISVKCRLVNPINFPPRSGFRLAGGQYSKTCNRFLSFPRAPR